MRETLASGHWGSAYGGARRRRPGVDWPGERIAREGEDRCAESDEADQHQYEGAHYRHEFRRGYQGDADEQGDERRGGRGRADQFAEPAPDQERERRGAEE